MNGFCERIIQFFYQAATGPGRTRKLLAPFAAGFFVGLILLAITASLVMDRFFGFARFVSRSYGAALSLPFLLGGALLWVWSVWRFLKTKGTPIPVNPPPVLVTDGLYAYSRNPMLAGVFLMLAGIGILFGSVTLTCIATPVFVFVSILEFKYIEEPELERRFGKAYREYKEKTPMIIPRFPRK
ncbi:MAG: isoprenylcysteine carboxylmethyltransferase family protein [Deltaproteobacteria bacterium]|nr:isoprenylcysteine carboxylmethyltransferase family protein [Deltaproteobacteria bacterium]